MPESAHGILPDIQAGGEMGLHLRACDWTTSPLGPPATWPQSLRTVANLVLNAKIPMFVAWGPELAILYNDAYAPILGPKHPHALGRRLPEVCPTNWTGLRPIAERALAGEATFQEDVPFTLERDGRPEDTYFTLSLSPVHDDAGKIAGLLCACAETTRKVLSERQFAAEGERLRELFHQAPSFMAFLRGPDHVFELVNAAYMQLVGHRDLVGKPVREALPELAGQGFFDRLDRVYATGRPFVGHGLPVKLQRRPGAVLEDRFVTFVFQPTKDSHGRITGIFVEGSDITEAKLAEERLRESERRFKATHDNAGVGICEVDREGRYLSLNGAFTRMTGFTMEDFAGKAYHEYIQDEEDCRNDRASFAALVRGDLDNYTGQRIYTDKNGRNWWAEVTTTAVRDENGRFLYAVRIIQDITDRKRAEEAQRQAKEEAERANRSKSTFLAAASHDLRQPIQSLLLFLDVLKPHVTAGGQEALRHLGRGLDALRDLLDSLLDISRMDAGILRPSIEDFPIREVIEQVGMGYTAIAAAKGLEFHIALCPATVRSDRTLLGRMLRNLVENALRYTETGRIIIECHEAGDRLRIDVRDTGIGIPADHLDWIWKEFHQVGNPERDRNRGLGLGLAIVQRLSALLDHPVRARSTLGQGSVFSIEVPLGRPAPAPQSETGPEAMGRGRLAVLVDDDAMVLLGLKAIFESWGYAVLVAGSADQAMEGLREARRRPDVVVADYRLREGRVGTEVLARIRDTYGADVPCIILTGETGEDIRSEAAVHGLGVIHKPVTPRQLADALSRLVAGGLPDQGHGDLDQME